MQGKRRIGKVNRNCKNLEDGSAKLQGRQQETDERENLDEFSSVAEIKLVAKKNEEGIKLKIRGRRKVP
jgi:hypothetical protein